MNQQAHLNPKLFDQDIEKVPTRDGFGEGLVLAGESSPNVVALCADLTESTRMQSFRDKFPERFIEVGVAEQNLVTVASGLAAAGKIPFCASYATFSPGRNWEQIRTTICYNDQPVKIIGSHAGISVGPDGATHQALEDIALMRALPNMVVIVPMDSIEAKKATMAIAATKQPSYLRLSRDKTPVISTEQTPFQIGKAEVLAEGKDIAIIACGQMVYQALQAAEQMKEHNISVRVINCHTLKPLDEKTILEATDECGAIVTVEEHQVTGGLGGAVAELVCQKFPVPMKIVGIANRFGESGESEELLEKFGLTTKEIIHAITTVLRMKPT
ncbi:transketolase [Candidatus Daviesbacteria bacterium RIFCSPHIGHO2_01_FULL_44_29]|uniref:Transketolase n=1 Tax=Candidatus Daviesbacteria bacterium RIFCSPHIGHO2_02_FULL_43_12 TaxID=1797776 RepID=A0A1F5KGT3_9BACT|nr:MAG: transketolase [Candidatus Daviesbacteria bacterium RIFCSPHIGHO2_01_FULL_44_29]OGE40147.1 MAG: transketolase [Candidatus Daviesbacteria bacterium RIFCSPHIGHO2_02_FULL_43_12]OGE40699.1 MAG: transketolase [Candidatus Daviesbacteria bacterium RIFCSPHIGHO2_12_FULL_47_45]OGE70470.1 MAG: transketolase [Candidatus Daviesbacteria bacterium RIFCSPLOWO2_01_FULL_43_15]